MSDVDAVIVGAGVVGLSIAKSLSEVGMEVLVIEKEHRSGEGISSRNSGVIHAGMYYPKKSLKAELCVRGNELLYEYCTLKHIGHKRLGKLIIASEIEENKKLLQIYEQGLANGVDLKLMERDQVQDLEPNVKCSLAIFSPNTGIIDVPELILALEGDIQQNNGLISYSTKFLGAKKEGSNFKIELNSGEYFLIKSPILINSGGLSSDVIASSMKDLKAQFIKKVYYWKGHYFKYSGQSPFKKLVYPVPKPGSLGIHFSIDIAGQSKFGPDLIKVDSVNYKFEKDLKSKFLEAIQSYWPEIDESKLQPDYCGIRPKLTKDSFSLADFYISTPSNHGIKGLYNLQGIESPGLTCSLAISKYISNLIQAKIN